MALESFKKKGLWLIFFIIFLLVFIVFKHKTKADLVYFYPQTCLGSFVNPEKAQGQKEVDNPDLINESNSAVYYGGFKEIYCGNFQGPIKEGKIKRITLHFNWVITKELREKPLIESTSTLETNMTTSDVPTIKNNTNSNEVNQTNSNKSQTATSSYENNKKSEMSVLSPNQSAYLKFINFVFAQSETQINTDTEILNKANTETQNNTSINEISTNSNESGISTSSQIGTTTSEPTSSSLELTTSSESTSTQTKASEEFNQALTEPTSTLATSSKALFDIHYTLDGQNWNYLGSVNENNWQNLTFDIPVNNWVDISKIQIKINSYPDTDYYLYLESMWLEVGYKNSQSVSIANIPVSTTNIQGNTSLTTATSIEEQEENLIEETNEITTPPEIPPPAFQELLEPLKTRKIERKIDIKNIDNLSYSLDQFSVNIKEGETKFINLKLIGDGIKNLEIGSLPNGIDVVFAENNDYQISTNKDIVQIKIYRQKGSERGNFSIPIIFNSKRSTIICQINIIATN
jgi:hypothetical protein